jgi:arginine/lysine/histidine transport system permease protein
MIDIQLIKDSLPLLLRGAVVTLEIAFCGALIGLIGGTILGVAQTSRSTILRWLVTLYVTIIRGTPMLIQITFAFFVLPEYGIRLPAFWFAVIAIGLNSAAYVSQIIKAGIRSIGRGQIEAGRVLGLSNVDIMRHIILPQAFRVVTPALGNEFITLVKDSSLASVIGVVELTKAGSIIRGRTLDIMSTYLAVALVYLIITTTLSLLINRFEQRMNRHVKN